MGGSWKREQDILQMSPYLKRSSRVTQFLTVPDTDLIYRNPLIFFFDSDTTKTQDLFAFIYSTCFSFLFFQCNIKQIYVNAGKDADSSVLRFEVCSDAIFRIHPTALPKPQPLPVLLGDSAAASPNLELELTVGVRGGVRGMWSSSPCESQVRVRLEVGVAAGVTGRTFMSSFL